MNPDSLNKWLTLLANLGVIAGIVFLGVEMQQNNEFLAAEAKFNMHQNQVALMDQITSSPQLSTIMAKALANEALTPGEQIQLQYLAVRTMRNWLWEFEEFQAGRIKLEEIPIEAWRKVYTGRLLPLPLATAFQMGDFEIQNPEFAKFIEENVAN